MTNKKRLTNKKKFLKISVAVSLLTALFVWNPGGTTGSLASSMISGISNPTVDHQILSLQQFGSSAGSAIDQFKYPRGVAVYEDKLFVTDTGNDRVKVMNKNTGALITMIGKKGGGNGEFSYPRNIVIDEKNKFFYVTDLSNHRVQKFNLDTYEYVAQVGTPGSGTGQFTNPAGIALDVENDRLYVSDLHCRVQRFELSTLEYRASWGGTCGSANNQFARINNAGPQSIAVDSAGNVYVADTWNDRIQKFTYDGTFLWKITTSFRDTSSSRNVDRPQGIFIDKGEYLYVSDTYNNRIQKFDLKKPGMPLVRTLQGGAGHYFNFSQFRNAVFVSYPEGIFVDKDTNIYVADGNTHKIKVFRQHIIVPTAPTNVLATANVTEIALTWISSSPRTGGTPLLEYVVEYTKASDTDWIRFSDGIGLNTTATITGLQANTQYDFRVFARNTAGEDGDISTQISKTTLFNTDTIANANGESNIAPVSEDYDTLLTAPTAPTPLGNTFDGGFMNAALTNPFFFLYTHTDDDAYMVNTETNTNTNTILPIVSPPTTTTGTTTVSTPTGTTAIDGQCGGQRYNNMQFFFYIEGKLPLTEPSLLCTKGTVANIVKSATSNSVSWDCLGQNGGKKTSCSKEYYPDLPRTGPNCGIPKDPKSYSSAGMCLNGSTVSAMFDDKKNYSGAIWYPSKLVSPYVFHWKCYGPQRIDTCSNEYSFENAYTYISSNNTGSFNGQLCKVPSNPLYSLKTAFCGDGSEFGGSYGSGSGLYGTANHLSGSGKPAPHTYGWRCLKPGGYNDQCEVTYTVYTKYTLIR